MANNINLIASIFEGNTCAIFSEVVLSDPRLKAFFLDNIGRDAVLVAEELEVLAEDLGVL
jgi:hypothetical protein